jgi:hypothetical protein
MAPSPFADPDSAAVPHLGGGRPGNDVPLPDVSFAAAQMLYRRTFGNIMLYLAAGVLYRRTANKGVGAPDLRQGYGLFAAKIWFKVTEALTAFSQVAPRQAKVVELRYFGGLTEEEIVEAMKISLRTLRRDWDLAKAWLLPELNHRIE